MALVNASYAEVDTLTTTVAVVDQVIEHVDADWDADFRDGSGWTNRFMYVYLEPH